MSEPRIIARLDIKNSNLIKSINLEGLKIIGDPNEYARKYYTGGADEILFMDCVATLYGRNNLSEIIKNSTKDIFLKYLRVVGLNSFLQFFVSIIPLHISLRNHVLFSDIQ